MSEQQQPPSRLSLYFASFFAKALTVIRPPFMKFLVVMVVAVLVYLLAKDCDNMSNVNFALFVLVVLISVFLAAGLQALEMLLRYSKSTTEYLKTALREEVSESEEERIENTKTKSRKTR